MKINYYSLHSKLLVLLLGLATPFVSCEEAAEDGARDNVEEIEIEFLLEINPRQADDVTGSGFASSIEALELSQREEMILSNIKQGNIPAFLRDLTPIEISMTIADSNYSLTFFVMPDYLSIGSDSDHFLMPMTPILAQKVADQLGGILPTRKMVDLIWAVSGVKLTPEPIPPSDAMVTVGIFREHNTIVEISRSAFLTNHPLGSLVSGHKKDVILSNRIASNPNKVVIYGWHYPSGDPIQPLYSGHVNWYADYSHGIRVILNKCLLNESVVDLSQILRDPNLYQLISDETGAMETTRYDTARSNYP
ncbi:MAG: hypothetical protein HQ506_09890 [Candidatus Marinimicrobia bacterium]|nr:hypothetical protein [Candidatus Neomarinimicrobiota bacterium]